MRRGILLGTFLGLALAILVWTWPGMAGAQQRSAHDVYEALSQAAAAGNAAAAAEKAAVDRYLAQNGLKVEDLGVPTQVRSSVAVGLITLTVSDSAPWHIAIDNTTRFASADELVAYISARTAAVRLLAGATPQREVEAFVSPAGGQSVPEFVGNLPCRCPVTQLIVDIYGPAGWMMTSGRIISGGPVDGATLEAQLLDQAEYSLDNFEGVERSEIRAEVRVARVRMTAESARIASESGRFLAVDLLTDIADAYRGRAASIDVRWAPDLREAYARLVQNQPIDADPVDTLGPEGGSQ